ncbi:MAG: putative dsRNA-binding protein, partial [Acidaminococcaceae bacterium]|nr:putative dsRNA-binding protein [Acidaminococcaceae bacterium]
LDQGLEQVRIYLDRLLLCHVDELAQEGIYLDYKTRLREEVQSRGAVNIVYEQLAMDGPAHDRTFTMRVVVDGLEWGRGSGHSKKEAEQHAAQVALQKKTSE